MVDLSSNIAVLRRWAHFRSDEPLPANFTAWRDTNGTDALQLQQQDPELFMLLSGTAPAGLVADALQGQFSPVPVTPAKREEQERKQEMQALYDASKSEEGLSLTQKIRLQAAYPELAKKVMQETRPRPARLINRMGPAPLNSRSRACPNHGCTRRDHPPLPRR